MTTNQAAVTTATVTTECFDKEKQPGTVELKDSGTVDKTNTDATLVNLKSSSDDSREATGDLPIVTVSPFLELLSMINETWSWLKAEHQHRQQLQEMEYCHSQMTQNLLAQLHARGRLAAQLRAREKELIEYQRVQTQKAVLRIRHEEAIEREHIIEQFLADLHVHDAKVIINEGLQLKQISLQLQLSQIEQHLNQMSETFYNLQTKVTNITNNKDNIYTLENSLNHSLSSFTQSTIIADLDTLNYSNLGTHEVRLDNNSGLCADRYSEKQDEKFAVVVYTEVEKIKDISSLIVGFIHSQGVQAGEKFGFSRFNSCSILQNNHVEISWAKWGLFYIEGLIFEINLGEYRMGCSCSWSNYLRYLSFQQRGWLVLDFQDGI